MGWFKLGQLFWGAVNLKFAWDTINSIVNFFGNRNNNETNNGTNNKLDKDNFNKNQNFANVNRNFRGGANNIRSTRNGVLSFLGDPSRRLDDAPDIVDENQSVLGGIETLGGFFPFLNTRTPNIDNQKIVDSGFLGVRLEIDKINRNIDAIAKALAESVVFEQNYRKDVINAMRRDLAEKGKDRSETRTERSIFNLITRPFEQAKKIINNVKNSNDFVKALLLSAGLEAANLFLPDGEGSEGSGEENKMGERQPFDADTTIIKEEVDPDTGETTQLTANEFNRKTYYVDQNGIVRFKKDDTPAILWNMTATKEDKEILDIKEYNTSQIKPNAFNNKNSNDTSVVGFNYNTKDLEGGTKITYIDLTSKKGRSGSGVGEDAGGASTELVQNIPFYDPARSSVYEGFVSA